MKTFNELQVGDKLYYIDARKQTMYISEISDIKLSENKLVFHLYPVVGPKTLLILDISKNRTFAITEKSLVFTSEVAFSIFKEFFVPNENV